MSWISRLPRTSNQLSYKSKPLYWTSRPLSYTPSLHKISPRFETTISNLSGTKQPETTLDDPEILSEYSTLKSTFPKPTITSQTSQVQHIVPFPEELGTDYSITKFLNSENIGKPFSKEICDILTENINPAEIEIKPDGPVYLPEIRYRKILNRAFSPGGWFLIPRTPHSLHGNILSREYSLICLGRFVSQARGFSIIQSYGNYGLMSETVRSNALMRCCKDLGIASDLWDNTFIFKWRREFAQFKTDPTTGRKFWAKK